MGYLIVFLIFLILFFSVIFYVNKELSDLQKDYKDIRDRYENIIKEYQGLRDSRILNQTTNLEIITVLRLRTQKTKIEIFYREGSYFYSEEDTGIVVRFENWAEFIKRFNYTVDLLHEDRSGNLMIEEAFNKPN